MRKTLSSHNQALRALAGGGARERELEAISSKCSMPILSSMSWYCKT